MKYIDAEKLIASLEQRKKQLARWTDKEYANQRIDEIDCILDVDIDSLQQERNSAQDTELTYFESALFTAFSYAWQSYLRGEEVNVAQWAKENSAELLEAARFPQEQPKVDLKKEIKTYFKGWYMDETDQGYILHTPDDHAGLMSVKQIARHFYELGLNAKEE